MVLVEGVVVGMARVYMRVPGQVSLRSAFVLPEHRHRGYFRGIFSKAASIARQEGFKSLKIGVLVDNLKAKSIYQGLGMIAEPGALYRLKYDQSVLQETKLFETVKAGDETAIKEWATGRKNILNGEE